MMKPRIVETLRACVAVRELPSWGDIDDAATEIERLERLVATLKTALVEIEKGSPDEDPGEGCWDSMADAWDSGVAAQAWDTAEIARPAIAAAEAAGITAE